MGLVLQPHHVPESVCFNMTPIYHWYTLTWRPYLDSSETQQFGVPLSHCVRTF